MWQNNQMVWGAILVGVKLNQSLNNFRVPMCQQLHRICLLESQNFKYIKNHHEALPGKINNNRKDKLAPAQQTTKG